MTSLELIDQWLKKDCNVRGPNQKQLELLKTLVEQELGTDEGKIKKVKHLKKVASAMRRDITYWRRQASDKEEDLAEVLLEIDSLSK